jgi:hypothetical protein
MNNEQYIDYVYNLGYNDALHGKEYRESFTDTMCAGSMDEYYNRGWNDGRQDR